jgi:hypothetical protein
MEKKYVFGWQRMGTIRLEVCGDGRHLRASIKARELGQRRYLPEKKNNSNGKWVSWISWKNRIVRVCEHQLIGFKFSEGRKMESRKKTMNKLKET